MISKSKLLEMFEKPTAVPKIDNNIFWENQIALFQKKFVTLELGDNPDFWANRGRAYYLNQPGQSNYDMNRRTRRFEDALNFWRERQRFIPDGIGFNSFRIVDNIFWKDGDFQDKGSCFWNVYKHHKDILEEADFLAILFYEEDNDLSRGTGRAWMLPYPQQSTNPSGWLIINAYSKRHRLQVHNIANTLGHILKAKYRHDIDDFSNWNHEKLLYVNNSYAAYFGMDEYISNDLTYTIGKPPEDAYCWACEEGYDIDDMTFIQGTPYCSECRNELFFSCSGCYNYFNLDEHSIYMSGYRTFCKKCYERERQRVR